MTSSWGGRRYNPYAFTEQGIYMLMTVLKGELAIKQSKTLIKLFKEMKDFILENNKPVETIEKSGFKIVAHKIKIDGICNKCDKEK